jgi:hypothetical protein
VEGSLVRPTLTLGGVTGWLPPLSGVINDMAATRTLLAQASQLPLSVIIVGVGAADFSQMVQLDGDDAPRAQGPGAARDIVQFIPMREYTMRGAAHLAKDTLAEVPGQFLAWCKSKGLMPSPPVAAPPPPGP